MVPPLSMLPEPRLGGLGMPPVRSAPGMIPMPGLTPPTPLQHPVMPPSSSPPAVAPMIPVPTLPPPLFAQPAAPAQHVPSEFTRILSAATPASLSAVPSAPAAPREPALPAAPAVPIKKPSYVPLVIGLNIVAILAIALVVFFLMRK